MLAFKFFVFISIVVNLFNSFKKVKEENSTMARTDEEDTVVVQIRYTSSQGGVVMNVRKAQRLRNMLLLIGVFMMLGSFFYEPLMISGIIVASSCLIPHFLFNKCPHCGKQLGNNEAKCCQHCGKEIDE